MPRYLPEPHISADTPPKIGVLLVNLGTPAAPTAAAVKPYLRQFLSDPRVVEIPKPLWWLILNGIILNTRPKKSAAKYASVWLKEGSPLKVWTEQQAKLVKGYLGEQYPDQLCVDYAMRYGAPSIADQIAKLKAANCQKILIVPMYPQYAASTTASVVDEVGRVLQRTRHQPTIHTLAPFFDDPGYIAALAEQVRSHWQINGRGEHLLMSFHGVPRYTQTKGDPYGEQSLRTGHLLAEALNLSSEQYTIAFQSRFGRAEWLKPYTSEVLNELGKKNLTSLDVICPGFIADCLETLEEIAIEGKHDFLQAGGKEYRFIAGLNANSSWIAAISSLIATELTAWLTNGSRAKPSNNQSIQSLNITSKQNQAN